MSYVVYGLEDPRDNLMHYVGITDDVYKRFIDHIKGSAGNIQKNGWIFECRQNNVMISMRELQRVDALEIAIEREKYWIKHYLDLGHPLNNMKIASAILKEQTRLERLAKDNVAKLILKEKEQTKSNAEVRFVPIPLSMHQPIDYELAVEAWKAGNKSARRLSSALSSLGNPVGKDKALNIIYEMKAKNLIS